MNALVRDLTLDEITAVSGACFVLKGHHHDCDGPIETIAVTEEPIKNNVSFENESTPISGGNASAGALVKELTKEAVKSLAVDAAAEMISTGIQKTVKTISSVEPYSDWHYYDRKPR